MISNTARPDPFDTPKATQDAENSSNGSASSECAQACIEEFFA